MKLATHPINADSVISPKDTLRQIYYALKARYPLFAIRTRTPSLFMMELGFMQRSVQLVYMQLSGSFLA